MIDEAGAGGRVVGRVLSRQPNCEVVDELYGGDASEMLKCAGGRLSE
jgi:hypothetical protein